MNTSFSNNIRDGHRGNTEIDLGDRRVLSDLRALAESRERQARLVTDAGHELRTPLTSLRTNVELLMAAMAPAGMAAGRRFLLRWAATGGLDLPLVGVEADELAFAAGFNSLSAFYSCFRRHTGMSPKAYLKQISLRARTQDKP